MRKSALIVFAKEPKAGKVKTRLCNDLPAAYVTRLYKAFIKDVLGTALKVRCDRRFLYYAGHGASIPFLRRAAGRFHLKRQTGRNLGERMYRAFARCRREGFGKTVLIGSDCVTLTAGDIERAFRALDRCDCVLGPSKDGGYYLIALNEPDRALFRGIDWSTSSVLSQTLKIAKKKKKSIVLLRAREDIDQLAQLKKLYRSFRKAGAARYTRHFFKSNVPSIFP